VPAAGQTKFLEQAPQLRKCNSQHPKLLKYENSEHPKLRKYAAPKMQLRKYANSENTKTPKIRNSENPSEPAASRSQIWLLKPASNKKLAEIFPPQPTLQGSFRAGRQPFPDLAP
jgi:hypothetical protein